MISMVLLHNWRTALHSGAPGTTRVQQREVKAGRYRFADSVIRLPMSAAVFDDTADVPRRVTLVHLAGSGDSVRVGHESEHPAA
jgi:hypothetical protein